MIYKMYCVVARESLLKMKGSRGKFGAQNGHAFLHAYWNSYFSPNPRLVKYANDYRESERAFKIVVSVETVRELERMHDYYKHVCGVSLVEDAGLTVFNEPTITCLGIGPIPVDLVDPHLQQLNPLT